MDMDDLGADLPQVTETAVDARSRRIAAAVERSKNEYKPEHAGTERDWFLTSTTSPLSGKKDRQRLEFVATRQLLAPSSSGEAPASIVADLLSSGKPANLSRELLATGIQSAIRSGDADSALLFATAARTHWRSYPGLAVLSSQAFAFAGRSKEATHPLLISTGSALHYPVLVALADTLRCVGEDELSRVLQNVAESRAWAFTGDIFSKEREARGGAPTLQANAVACLDGVAMAERLCVEQSVVDKALDRIARALGGGDDEPAPAPGPGERVERGVRDL